MAIKNNVFLVGRLTKDVTTFYKQTQSGQLLLAQVPIAVDRPRNSNGNNKVDFLKLKFIGNRWEKVCPYLQKGTKVIIQGQIQSGQYEDKTGNRVFTIDILVEELELDGKPASE